MKISRRKVTYKELYDAIVNRDKIALDTSVKNAVVENRKHFLKFIEEGSTIYGINTGFGALKDKKIENGDILKLQENLIRSHATGVGNLLGQDIVKLIMLIMALYLSKGFSGVRVEVIETLLAMVNRDVIPLVPEKGSVGASGDLAPAAHVALVLIGLGEAQVSGKKLTGARALKLAGIKPLKLETKEGLALINNTATMTAIGTAALYLANTLADISDIAGALSAQALMATRKAFDPRIHELKPYKGQILVARSLRKLLAGSKMIDESRVQDQYSIRCMPQVHGAVREAIGFAEGTVNTEINSVTDNPLFFSGGKSLAILSGGNFHGESVAIAMDSLRLAVCALANISDRRIFSLLDVNHNFGLPPFLAQNPGLNSGLMILQYTTASLVSENKILAHPASVDSIPTSANIEDFVSMGTISARKTLEVLENVNFVLATELIVACQAIDFRLKMGFKLAKETLRIYKEIRKIVPFFKGDQEYYPYIQKVSEFIKRGGLKWV